MSLSQQRRLVIAIHTARSTVLAGIVVLSGATGFRDAGANGRADLQHALDRVTARKAEVVTLTGTLSCDRSLANDGGACPLRFRTSNATYDLTGSAEIRTQLMRRYDDGDRANVTIQGKSRPEGLFEVTSTP